MCAEVLPVHTQDPVLLPVVIGRERLCFGRRTPAGYAHEGLVCPTNSPIGKTCSSFASSFFSDMISSQKRKTAGSGGFMCSLQISNQLLTGKNRRNRRKSTIPVFILRADPAIRAVALRISGLSH
jgi:hypothetical protein